MRDIVPIGAVWVGMAALLFGVSGCATSSNQSNGSESAEKREISDSKHIPVGDSPVRGPEDALVTVVQYSDFQCPFCAKGYRRVQRLRANHPDEVRVVFKHFPLGKHAHARTAARVAMAAGEQGDEYFWKMHDRLFEHQKKWKDGGVVRLANEWAAEMQGFDIDAFDRALENNREAYDERIDRDVENGKELGVRGTPHFFINGTALSGAQPYARFESAVDALIEQAKTLMESDDVDRSNVYRAAVAENFEPPS